MADFAFNKSDVPHVDIYSGEGGKDSELLHRKVPLERAARILKADHGDIAMGVTERGRADYGTHVAVRHGARKPGKYRSDRHG